MNRAEVRRRPTRRGAADPRRCAIEIVERALSARGAFAQELLSERLAKTHFKVEDRRLCAELTYGVIRRLATLDAVIAAYADAPFERIEPAARHILRLGIYQLLFLDRVPDHAAVDESVRLAHAMGSGRASGFVNGVLRALARDVRFAERADADRPRESFELLPGRACTFGRPVLPPPARLAAWLAASQSFPEWLMGRWLARCGTTRARQLCAVSNAPPPLFVRPNCLRTATDALRRALAEEGVEAAPSVSGRTLRLPPHTIPDRLMTFREGLFAVQDDAAAQTAPFLDPQPGEKVLDLCAAPGGKTCHMAELMENRGEIVAVDASRRRHARLRENMQRLGCNNVTVVEADAADFAVQHRGRFDRVLLDAPCSNTGVLRRRVEARWRLSDAALAQRVALQRKLLGAALLAVKLGGRLVYSTCSLEPEENGELVAAVLASAEGFRLDEERQLEPERDGGDGIYMARIVRGNAEATS